MLCSINSGKYVKTLSHKKNYDKWHKHLSDENYAKIIDELGKRIDSQEINTAGWIPGHDWTGTVFEPIYYACGRNERQAGMFFGLILFNWKIIIYYRSNFSLSYFSIEKSLIRKRSIASTFL